MILLKLFLAPVLIAAATLVQRRWGARAGGWIAGLPLTSGPVSVFLAFDQGDVFAARAAEATLLGTVAVTAFCVAYAEMSRAHRWPRCLACAIPAFFVAAWMLREADLGPVAAFLLAALVMGLALRSIGEEGASGERARSPRWDIWARMIAAMVLVAALTAAAPALGPQWSGLLSPFPVFAGVLTVFSHRDDGPAAARHVLRGVLIGGFAFLAFFLVTALGVERLGAVIAYLLATAAALATCGLTARPARAVDDATAGR
jgi:hypothetical protein